MEIGKTYKVLYDDGGRVRDKRLIFRGVSGAFIVFYNPHTCTEEIIGINRIVRMELVKDE